MKQKIIPAGLLLIASFAASVLPCRAATITWINTAGGDWNVAANWSPNKVPGSSDTANITMAGTYAVTLDVNPNVKSLTIGGAASGVQSLVADGFNLEATNALINGNGILSLTNSSFTGGLVVTSGAVFSINGSAGNGVTVDGQVTVENGGEMLLSGGQGIYLGNGVDPANSTYWLWLQGGAKLIGVSGFALILEAPMTNSGTCFLTNGYIQNYNDNGNNLGGLVNLAGGVINLDSGAAINGSFGYDYLVNEGTINVTDGASEIDLGLGLLSGNYNAAAGATVEFETDSAAGTSLGAGLTLGGSGQYEFDGGLFTLESNTIPNLQYVAGTLMLGSNFQGGAITNLALEGITLTNTLPVTGTFSVTNSTLLGSYVVTSGAVFSINGSAGNGVTVDGQVTVENGGEMLLSGDQGIYLGNGSDPANSTYWLWLQSGAKLIGVSGFDLILEAPMTNSGTCFLTNGYIQNYNDNGNNWGGLVNLAGGVINLDSGAAINGSFGYDYLVNEGTINVTDGVSEIDLGLGLLSGNYNAAAGTTVEFETDSAAGTSVGASLTLGGSGHYQFQSGLLTVTNYPIPNLKIETSATLTFGPDFQGGTITNLTLAGITFSNALPVTGTFSVSNSTLLGSYLVANGGVLTIDGVTVDAQVTVENGGELQLLADGGYSSVGDGSSVPANYWLWLQGGAKMIGASGFVLELDFYPMTNSGICSLTNGEIFVNAAGLVNLAGGVINLFSGANIVGYNAYDYLVNEGGIDVFSADTNSIISVDNVTNFATLSVEGGTLDLESTNLMLEPSGILNVGLNSATDYGSIVYSNAANLNLAQAGTFQVTLNGGYVPVPASSFTVMLTSSSGTFSGAFANFSSPDGAIWQTNYTATSLVLANVGQIVWATPANITYGAGLNSTQLKASTTPSVAGTFTYLPKAGAVLNSGAGQLLTATFTPSTASYAPASLQVPLTVLRAPLSVTATNQTKTYGGNFHFAGTEFVAGGLVNGDVVTSASLASAGAISNAAVSGSPYAITISNALGDTGLTNYIINYTDGSLTVTPAPLGITANSFGKIYGSNVIFAGTEFVSTTLSNSETIGTITLTSAGAISNAPVSGSPYTIMPSAATGGTFSAANYAITYTNGALTVSPAPLTVSSGISANNKVYDGTPGATITSNNVALPGVLAGDTVNLTTNGYIANFTSAGAGNGIAVTVTGLKLAGASAANYVFTQPTALKANITSKPLTMSGLSVPLSKVYDGTTTAVVGNSPGLLQATEAPGAGSSSDGKPYAGDAVSLTGTATGAYNNKDVATASTVTFGGLSLSGAQAGDYTLTIQGAASAAITAKTLSLSGLAVPSSKVYDGTTTAVVSGSPGMLQAAEAVGAGSNSDGKPYTGDGVSLAGTATGTYNSKDVATAATVTFGGLSLNGVQAGDYSLTIQVASPATISPKGLSVTSGITANNKYFDNTTAATLSFNSVVLQGIVTGDIVTVNPVGYTANFGGAGVGSGIAVTVAGLSLSGAAAADYSLTQPTGLTASITVPSLQILSALPNIVLSWPTNAGAFVLNTAPSLASASAWTAVTGGIVASGTNNTFTTNASNGDGFYKLIAP